MPRKHLRGKIKKYYNNIKFSTADYYFFSSLPYFCTVLNVFISLSFNISRAIKTVSKSSPTFYTVFEKNQKRVVYSPSLIGYKCPTMLPLVANRKKRGVQSTDLA
jgi:hypothetical protein